MNLLYFIEQFVLGFLLLKEVLEKMKGGIWLTSKKYSMVIATNLTSKKFFFKDAYAHCGPIKKDTNDGEIRTYACISAYKAFSCSLNGNCKRNFK